MSKCHWYLGHSYEEWRWTNWCTRSNCYCITLENNLLLEVIQFENNSYGFIKFYWGDEVCLPFRKRCTLQYNTFSVGRGMLPSTSIEPRGMHAQSWLRIERFRLLLNFCWTRAVFTTWCRFWTKITFFLSALMLLSHCLHSHPQVIRYSMVTALVFTLLLVPL